MRKLYILLLLCAVVSMAQAQKITRNYKNQSLSRVLEDLNAATNRHEISFVYNDLENFTVTCKLEHLNLGDALIKVVGFYPVHIVRDGATRLCQYFTAQPCRFLSYWRRCEQ